MSLGAILLAFWLMMSGHYGGLMISLGVASVVVTVWIAHRMETTDHEGHPMHLAVRGMTFWPWLYWEIIKSNIDVAKIILSPKMPISPQVFVTKASQSDELGRVVYANSITLTPGTVTMGIDDDQLEVHALTRDTAAGVQTGDMDRRVCKLMGEA
ncbi:Na+/H+ antiporter subunit E [Magnetospira sp. QH-2]|uniref:Na+/H+ antiporter subunit E n=1 Tax=Magnetospira sp. (strain QH-2) TaxID=1288970 RepID=UPI0018E09F13|nr:Na+/H+ antiporter subunit E [Magnetospira sp. QH-2]